MLLILLAGEEKKWKTFLDPLIAYCHCCCSTNAPKSTKVVNVIIKDINSQNAIESNTTTNDDDSIYCEIPDQQQFALAKVLLPKIKLLVINDDDSNNSDMLVLIFYFVGLIGES